MAAAKQAKIEKIIKAKSGIRLDIGGGASPQLGFVNMDIRPLPQVDIVHDLEKTPWPLKDNSVLTAIASHVLEHIDPHGGVFINVMNEIWRVLKPGGQFAFVVPYAGSPGFWQDPTHCNGITEATMYYFDPEHESQLYKFYKPKPWKIEMLTFKPEGNLECVLSKRKLDKKYGA